MHRPFCDLNLAYDKVMINVANAYALTECSVTGSASTFSGATSALT